jgi:hypothetical protein
MYIVSFAPTLCYLLLPYTVLYVVHILVMAQIYIPFFFSLLNRLLDFLVLS